MKTKTTNTQQKQKTKTPNHNVEVIAAVLDALYIVVGAPAPLSIGRRQLEDCVMEVACLADLHLGRELVSYGVSQAAKLGWLIKYDKAGKEIEVPEFSTSKPCDLVALSEEAFERIKNDPNWREKLAADLAARTKRQEELRLIEENKAKSKVRRELLSDLTNTLGTWDTDRLKRLSEFLGVGKV